MLTHISTARGRMIAIELFFSLILLMHAKGWVTRIKKKKNFSLRKILSFFVTVLYGFCGIFFVFY
jgi:hypothetical protein